MDYDYKVRDCIKLMHDKNNYMRPTKLSAPREGVHQIIEVCNNGALKMQSEGY